MMKHDREFYEQCMVMEREKATAYWNTLRLIAAEARAELARVEKHGGCAGFAYRVLALAEGGSGDGQT